MPDDFDSKASTGFMKSIITIDDVEWEVDNILNNRQKILFWLPNFGNPYTA